MTTSRDRRGRGHHPPRPEGDPRGGGLRRRGRDRPGRRGRRAGASAQPDLAILDIKMPGMDGLEAARAITAERGAAVLILTAFSQRDLIEQARDAGALAYLVKPFQKSELIPAVEVALGRFAEMKALADENSLARRAARHPQARRPGQGHPHGQARPRRGRRLPLRAEVGDGQPPLAGRGRPVRHRRRARPGVPSRVEAPGWIDELGLGRGAGGRSMGVRADDRPWPRARRSERAGAAAADRSPTHPTCIAALPGQRGGRGRGGRARRRRRPRRRSRSSQGDDLCLLAPEPGWPLVAGAVLFPSHWHLRRQARAAAGGGARPGARLPGRPGRPLPRPAAARPGRVAPQPAPAPRRRAARARRPRRRGAGRRAGGCAASARRSAACPRTGAVLFTIHTDTAPLADLDAGDAGAALADRLDALPPTWAPYAGVGAAPARSGRPGSASGRFDRRWRRSC